MPQEQKMQKNLGRPILKSEDAFYELAQQWRELGQITYPQMLEAGVPKGM